MDSLVKILNSNSSRRLNGYDSKEFIQTFCSSGRHEVSQERAVKPKTSYRDFIQKKSQNYLQKKKQIPLSIVQSPEIHNIILNHGENVYQNMSSATEGYDESPQMQSSSSQTFDQNLDLPVNEVIFQRIQQTDGSYIQSGVPVPALQVGISVHSIASSVDPNQLQISPSARRLYEHNRMSF